MVDTKRNFLKCEHPVIRDIGINGKPGRGFVFTLYAQFSIYNGRVIGKDACANFYGRGKFFAWFPVQKWQNRKPGLRV